MITSPKPSRKEIQNGAVFLVLWLFILPSLFGSLPFPSGIRNFLYYLISFLSVALIFRRYLLGALQAFRSQPLRGIGCAAAGFALNFAAVQLLTALFSAIYPDYLNQNDQTVLYTLQEAPVLMTVGVTLLVPVTEETLFRGLIFRTLYDRSPAAACLISIAAFSLIHVMGYIGKADTVMLLLSFVQYLPAGLCLCLVYRYGGTLLSSIVLHAAINAAAILTMR